MVHEINLNNKKGLKFELQLLKNKYNLKKQKSISPLEEYYTGENVKVYVYLATFKIKIIE